MNIKRKTYASAVLVSVALSLAVYVGVTSYSQEELFDNSLATENIEALSNSEDNKYSVDNEVIAYVNYRSGKCYLCKVQYTYKKDGKTYAHYNNEETGYKWKRCLILSIPKDDPRVKDNCLYKFCPGSQSEAPIEEDLPLG